MRSYYVLFILAALFFSSLQAQQEQYHWRIGLHSGIISYQGDLSNQLVDANPALINLFDNLDYLTNGLSAEKSLSPGWGMRMMYTKGQFIVNDRHTDWDGKLKLDYEHLDRALNAKTELWDLSLLFNWQLDNDKILSRSAIIAPYWLMGAGYTNFEVFADLYTANGGRYYYWPDNTIRSLPVNSGEAPIIEQDGTFETNVSKLKTEGRDYSNASLHLALGLGLKFRLSPRWNLNIESLWRFTDTDYLDDVNGRYLTSYENRSSALCC